MDYCVYYNGEASITPPLGEDHATLLRALVNFEQTGETHAIFSSIAASPEPDLPGYAGVLEVSEDREHLLPEEGESRHGIRLWLRLLLQYLFVPFGYAAYPQAQGLIWPSRQDDRARAVVLFETRVEASALRPAGISIPLIENGVIHELAKALATDLKVLIE
jgi:hypothetical protein